MSRWVSTKLAMNTFVCADTCCQGPRLPASTLSCVIIIQGLFYTVTASRYVLLEFSRYHKNSSLTVWVGLEFIRTIDGGSSYIFNFIFPIKIVIDNHIII